MQFTTLSSAVKALTLALALGSVDAFWRMPCRSRSGLARVDPLVSFGTVSEHAHAIHGSSGMFTPRPPSRSSNCKQSHAVSLLIEWSWFTRR